MTCYLFVYLFICIVFIYLFIYLSVYLYIDKVNLGIEINTPKKASENVAQPGIEPGSPGYWLDTLTTRPLHQRQRQ